jgi:hypothetical protein
MKQLKNLKGVVINHSVLDVVAKNRLTGGIIPCEINLISFVSHYEKGIELEFEIYSEDLLETTELLIDEIFNN